MAPGSASSKDKGLTSWPFIQAQRLLEHCQSNNITDRKVVFATGYGPSGLPHIGTFAEVARTSMVRRAFSEICDLDSELIVFSDDMDALRKVPDNVPQAQMLAQHLGKPLTSVPDPYGKYASFGAHNNAWLCSFLDQFGFDYNLVSATSCYQRGDFNDYLAKVLDQHQAIIDVIAPTLGVERQKTYSPFLPLDEETGCLIEAKVTAIDALAKRLTYTHPQSGVSIEQSILSGACKLQWKADWAMRWAAIGVDYEMAGKDLRDSIYLSGRINRLLEARPPVHFIYELFLDSKGEKISKSKGNGLSVDQWLRYANQESLSLFLFQHPQRAKRLYFDVIPKSSDEYLALRNDYNNPDQDSKVSSVQDKDRRDNPVWHIHAGSPPGRCSIPSFSMLLNLVSACNGESEEVLWSFLSCYDSNLKIGSDPLLDQWVSKAVTYFQDFIQPSKIYRLADDQERAALEDLTGKLISLPEVSSDNLATTIQSIIYDVGKDHGFDPLRDWFSALYAILLGQFQGPRMGSFIAIYGVENCIGLIEQALAGQLINGKTDA